MQESKNTHHNIHGIDHNKEGRNNSNCMQYIYIQNNLKSSTLKLRMQVTAGHGHYQSANPTANGKLTSQSSATPT